ncbi:MAG: phospholipid carrier-dependent glycosyltransferase [Chloroflexi bacterium]|nr:phospholipid carrier-dependent glycosyltransferase [Chloroflexota bacterium]
MSRRLALRRPWHLAGITLIGLSLRLPPLWAHRFHQDEALYASWALLISTRRDIMLRTVPVDKPPFFLYTLATFFSLLGSSEVVARLPGLIAGALSIPLVYGLARRLYDARTAWVATALFVASPMAILFSPTAFTDPLMLFFGLLGCLAAAHGLWPLAGLGVGMAAVTKQQGILFLPLVLTLGWAIRWKPGLLASPAKPPAIPALSPGLRAPLRVGYRLPLVARIAPSIPTLPRRWHAILSVILFALGVAYPIWKAFQWDHWRYLPPGRPGFLEQSVISYGGLRWAPPTEWPARLAEWSHWMTYLTGSIWLNALGMIGLPWLAWWAWRHRHELRGRADLALLGYGAAYVGLHIAVGFQIWDRYLLPLAPIAALLGARILLAGTDAIMRGWERRTGLGIQRLGTILLAIALLVVLAKPALTAANSGFPVGSDHGAYDGIDRVAAFLKQELPPGAVLYHRWLGWHWRYYLYDVLFNYRYYDSTEALVADADGPPQIVRYIVFPGWRLAERDEARAALAARGIAMIPRFRTYRSDGSLSFVVYRIERVGGDDR